MPGDGTEQVAALEALASNVVEHGATWQEYNMHDHTLQCLLKGMLLHVYMKLYVIVLCQHEAPASEVGRLARAFKASAGGKVSADVEHASRVHESHAARDSQRVFRNFGLTPAVPITQLDIPPTQGSFATTLPVLKVCDFLKLLLRRHSKLLFGGAEFGEKSAALCRSFWQKYQQFQGDHKVFSTYGPQEWGTILPICIHGDKGRTKVKLPIFNFSFESVFGLPPETRRRSDVQHRREYGGKMDWACGQRAAEQLPNPDLSFDDSTCPIKRRKLNCGDAVPTHNGRGHSILTRFLITAIPSKTYKSHPNLISEFLASLKEDLCQAFEGIQATKDGPIFRAALIGVKGDYEFHLEVGSLNRTYQNIGHATDRAFCPECSAGLPDVAAFDFRSRPVWASTCYASNPWSSTPILSQVPFACSKLASLYRRDAFHTLKFGFLKDLAAGIIWFLAELSFFDAPGDPTSIESRLERAFSKFKLWQLAASKFCTLRKFSKSNLHKEKAKQHAYLSGKGSDSVVCLMFLEFYLRILLQQATQNQKLLRAMLETT